MFFIASWTTSSILSRSPSMRTKGVTLADLSEFCFLCGLMELCFYLFLKMKGDSKPAPPSCSPSIPTSSLVHSILDSSRSIVACNVVAFFSFGAFVSLAETLSCVSSFSFAEVSFFYVAFSFVEAFCASLFFSFTTAVVFSASPSTT